MVMPLTLLFRVCHCHVCAIFAYIQAALLGATVRCSSAGDAVVTNDNAERQKWKASLKAANTPRALVRTEPALLCLF
jgi:hypothetical protein